LPEAHVEAPTGGSIMLAAVLLKLGFYGLYRFLIPIVPVISHYYGIFICMIGLVSVTHAMLAATRQADAKRIVAYCSIAHMNVGIMALFTFTAEGVLGSCYGMLAHGIVSAALFFLIGILYSRYGTRNIEYYGGAFHYMPLFSFFFFIFTLGNISFPMTMNFIAEFMMIMSISTYSKILLLFLIFGFTLNLFVALYLFVRVCYGV
jgi:NADH:ubiquinone oxidoreductase subunit 4 (subunit M)